MNSSLYTFNEKRKTNTCMINPNAEILRRNISVAYYSEIKENM
jgi:hypothetical protein